IQLIRAEHAHRDPAADAGFVIAALHPASQLVNGIIERDAQLVLVNAGLVDMPAHAEQLRAGRGLGAHRLKPLGSTLDDVRDAAERLDVVDDRRAREGAGDRGEWRLVARPAALAFDGFEQAGFLAADISARAAVDVAL